MPADHDRRDVIDVLTREHRRVEDMFAQVISLPRTDRRRRYVVAEAIIELARHAVAEERYVYPAIRAHVPDGDRLAAEKIADHAATRRMIRQMDGLDPSDERFEELFSRLVGRTHRHLADEEAELFPRLADAVDAGTLRHLGAMVERSNRATPVWPCPPEAPSPGFGPDAGPGERG